jgi:hypothetical protein
MRIMTVAFALGTALVLCNLGTFSAAAHARKAKVVGEPRVRGYRQGARGKVNSLLGLLYCSTISLSPRGRPGRSMRRARSAGNKLWASGGNGSVVAGERLGLGRVHGRDWPCKGQSR